VGAGRGRLERDTAEPETLGTTAAASYSRARYRIGCHRVLKNKLTRAVFCGPGKEHEAGGLA
jgi:hypothetical protein